MAFSVFYLHRIYQIPFARADYARVQSVTSEFADVTLCFNQQKLRCGIAPKTQLQGIQVGDIVLVQYLPGNGKVFEIFNF